MSLLNKISAGWKVLKAGEMVANPVAWKRGQITVGYLVGFLSASVVLVRSLGYEIPVSDEQLSAIATVILFIYGLFNNVATSASTDKINLLGQEPRNIMVPSSIITGHSDKANELGRYPPSPDKAKLSDEPTNTMARDSSLG